jgi:hypothetical protein
MMPIEIRGDLSQLREVAIPWEERAILYGRQAPRNFTTGDLLLWGDATPLPKEIVAQPDEVLIHVSLASMTMVPDFLRVDQQIGFMIRSEAGSADVNNGFVNLASKRPKAELLGPFIVKAIGTRLVDADHPESESGDPRILTIPVKYLKSLKQLEDKADRLQASLTGYSEERVVGVVLFPDGTTN